MKKILVIFYLIYIPIVGLFAQEKTINGKVISQTYEPVHGVLIIMNDTIEIGRTDSIGCFQIDIPISVERLTFKYVGFEPVIIENFDQCQDIDIVMILNGTYDFMSRRKVNRIRKKIFRKLPKLHKKAFLRGIFKTEKVCYTRKFRP